MKEVLKVEFNGDFIEISHPKGVEIERQSMDEYWNTIGDACARYDCQLVLVEAEAPRRRMNTMDAFGSGIKASEVAIRLRLALCFSDYKPDELSEFFKTVAYNRGVTAEFFSTRTDALKWLGVCDKKNEKDAD